MLFLPDEEIESVFLARLGREWEDVENLPTVGAVCCFVLLEIVG